MHSSCLLINIFTCWLDVTTCRIIYGLYIEIQIYDFLKICQCMHEKEKVPRECFWPVLWILLFMWLWCIESKSRDDFVMISSSPFVERMVGMALCFSSSFKVVILRHFKFQSSVRDCMLFDFKQRTHWQLLSLKNVAEQFITSSAYTIKFLHSFLMFNNSFRFMHHPLNITCCRDIFSYL